VRPWLRGNVLDVGAGGGALAEWVPPERYAGVEPDTSARSLATTRHPRHRFEARVPVGELFDTIVALAVIEHVPNPSGFLADLGAHLELGGRLVLTTPHPAGRWLHECAAYVGLASRHAAREHRDFLDRAALLKAARAAGLELCVYKRLLSGLGQLVVLERRGGLGLRASSTVHGSGVRTRTTSA
jgi:2-polyprenyl-3-methyl-5-hydroxy-6-metoxy-1,4-benzoquinol methylase